jgi:hypothetical protein
MEMTNGIRASYEGAGTAAGEQNPWHGEYYRAECEDGAVAVGPDSPAAPVRGRPRRVVRLHRFARGQGLVTEEVPPLAPAYEHHEWLIDEFLRWLDGGQTPATALEDNVQSAAMLFAAIEASHTTKVVDVQAMVADLRRG